MKTYTLQFKRKELEGKFQSDEWTQQYLLSKIFFYISLALALTFFIAAFITVRYQLYFILTLCVILIAGGQIAFHRLFAKWSVYINSFHSLSWCLLVSTLLFYLRSSNGSNSSSSSDGGSEGESQQQGGDYTDSQETSATGAFDVGPTALFLLGGAAYSVHIALMISAEMVANVATFFLVNVIYTLSATGEPAHVVVMLVLPTVFVGAAHYVFTQTRKQYYELVEKYFIWYYISNFVMPQRLIVTKFNGEQKCIELLQCNKGAEKMFAEAEEIDSLTARIKVNRLLLLHPVPPQTQQLQAQALVMMDDQANNNNNQGQLQQQQQQQALQSVASQRKSEYYNNNNNNNLNSKQQQQQQQQYTILMPSTVVQPQQHNSQEISLQKVLKDEVKKQLQENTVISNNNNNNNNSTLRQNVSAFFSPQQQGVGSRRQRKSFYLNPQDELEQVLAGTNVHQQQQPTVKTATNNNNNNNSNNNNSKGGATLYRGSLLNKQRSQSENFVVKILLFQLEQPHQIIWMESDEHVQKQLALEDLLQKKQATSEKFAVQMNLHVDRLMFSLQRLAASFFSQQLQIPGQAQQQQQQGQLQQQQQQHMPPLYYQQCQSNSTLKQFSSSDNNTNSNLALTPYPLMNECLYFGYSVLNHVSLNCDLGPAEQGRMEVNPRVFSLTETVGELVQHLRAQAEERHVQIIFKNEVEQQRDSIFNDDRRVLQILLFLLLNCLDSTEDGFVIVQVIQGPGDSANNTLKGAVKVQIRDNSQRQWFKNACRLRDRALEARDLDEIEFAVCCEIAKQVGPFDKIFLKSEPQGCSNRVSFYIYSDIAIKQVNNQFNPNDEEFADEALPMQGGAVAARTASNNNNYSNNNYVAAGNFQQFQPPQQQQVGNYNLQQQQQLQQIIHLPNKQQQSGAWAAQNMQATTAIGLYSSNNKDRGEDNNQDNEYDQEEEEEKKEDLSKSSMIAMHNPNHRNDFPQHHQKQQQQQQQMEIQPISGYINVDTLSEKQLNNNNNSNNNNKPKHVQTNNEKPPLSESPIHHQKQSAGYQTSSSPHHRQRSSSVLQHSHDDDDQFNQEEEIISDSCDNRVQENNVVQEHTMPQPKLKISLQQINSQRSLQDSKDNMAASQFYQPRSQPGQSSSNEDNLLANIKATF